MCTRSKKSQPKAVISLARIRIHKFTKDHCGTVLFGWCLLCICFFCVVLLGCDFFERRGEKRIVRPRPIEKTSENRSFLTLTRNFSTKIQNWAKMDGTIGFALLFCVGTNYHFLISNRLLSRRHAFKGGGWDEWFSLILRPPQPYQISTGPNAFRERKKKKIGREGKTRMSHLSRVPYRIGIFRSVSVSIFRYLQILYRRQNRSVYRIVRNYDKVRNMIKLKIKRPFWDATK